MTLEKAIELLKVKYENAKRLDFVKNPTAWALYHVWKLADLDRREKENDE